MTADEVGKLIASFRQAAFLAQKSGFDGVEIHGANHSLFISCFRLGPIIALIIGEARFQSE